MLNILFYIEQMMCCAIWIGLIAAFVTAVNGKPQSTELEFEGCTQLDVLNSFCNSRKCRNFYTKNCYEDAEGHPPKCDAVEKCLAEPEADQFQPEVESEGVNRTDKSGANCSKVQVLRNYCNTKQCKGFYSNRCYKLANNSNSTLGCEAMEKCADATAEEGLEEFEKERKAKYDEAAEKLIADGHSGSTVFSSYSLFYNLVFFTIAKHLIS